MSNYPVSPLAPACLPDMPPLAGVKMSVAQAGIKYAGRNDVLLMKFAEGTTCAGVFTRSKAPSAAVDWCRANLGQPIRALVVNSGNANAFTGKKGVAACQLTAEATASALGINPQHVMLASTGVIGEPLDGKKIEAVMPQLAADLHTGGWHDAAATIMTTDTFAKAETRTMLVKGKPITIHGIAKGSGMIAPDMATMLAFIATDAAVSMPVLQTILQRANGHSFNCMTVDGDTSTSDTCLLFATGASGIAIDNAVDIARFEALLTELMTCLAKWVAKDGEGAQKFITVDVTGAEHHAAAKKIALSIANSPLIKTAIAGEDANWGRVVMAVGKSGEKVDRDRLSVSIGGVLIAKHGERVEGFDEAPVRAHMATREIHLHADIGLGNGHATVWTCDLTHGYISINADYRS